MLNDLDGLMGERNLQAVVVLGDTTLGNPDLTYVAGGQLARGGIYVKRLGHDPLLVTSNLDIGTARRLGRIRRIHTFTELGLEKLAAKHGRENAQQYLIASILRSEGIRGKVSIYGRNDLSSGIRLADELRKLGANVVGERSPTTLECARETKSREEIKNVRDVGTRTARVVEAVLRTLKDSKRKRGRLYLGSLVATVGLVKKLISSRLAQEDLIAPEGTIFAIGASGADPHNSGIPSDPIKEGRPIVFDIFPQSRTGYWFDLTRTFVVGRADAKTKRLFETVSEAQQTAMDFLKEGVTGEAAMMKACAVIEEAGYKTIREVYEGRSKSIASGFNHSLGHGVGLTIGERPYLSFLSRDSLKSGQIVTVEPGVYLPRYGGIRIEDTVVITRRGIDNLASVGKQLELNQR
jgi:Xaa-Pro aminopeptidase